MPAVTTKTVSERYVNKVINKLLKFHVYIYYIIYCKSKSAPKKFLELGKSLRAINMMSHFEAKFQGRWGNHQNGQKLPGLHSTGFLKFIAFHIEK